MNPVSLKSYDVLKELKIIRDIFGSYVRVRPLYKFKNLEKKFDEEFLKQHCFWKGRYCGVEGDGFESLSVLEEGIRQICVWEVSENESGKRLWWDYVFNYRNCLIKKINMRNEKKNLDCYKEIYYRNKIPEQTQTKIENCIQNSFANKKNKYISQNYLLEKNKNKKDYKNIYLVPAIFLNNNLLKEDLKENIIISAICDKLKSKPQACKKYLEILDWEGNSRINFGKGFLICFFCFILGLVALFAILVFLKKRVVASVKREAGFEIQSHISNYMKLQNSR